MAPGAAQTHELMMTWTDESHLYSPAYLGCIAIASLDFILLEIALTLY